MKSFFLTILFTSILFSQNTRLYVPVNIQKAYEEQTRSWNGTSGPKYWQNRADYNIRVELDPETGIITGEEEIKYFNNSPDALDEIYIHVFMNVYKKGNPREFNIDWTDAHDGVDITSVMVNNEMVKPDEIEYLHNDFKILLQNPLKPGAQLDLAFNWQYGINKNSHMRTGQVDSSSYFVAYFFPRIAVYDDIDGWNDFKYAGSAEFYNDFGNFNLAVTVPKNYLVWATGMLQNVNEVLQSRYADRLLSASTSHEVTHIIDSTESMQKNITTQNEKNTWRFNAENVSDVAFAVSDHYLWDATSLVVDDDPDKRVLINAVFSKHSKDFYKVARVAQQSIQYMSETFPGILYPYPVMTVFNGRDEMEYPMMVNNLSTSDPDYLIKITSHEILHTYLPFYMGINESKYAWMDEGFASFGDYLIVTELAGPDKTDFFWHSSYLSVTGTDLDTPIITNSKYLKRPVYNYNAYTKAASFFFILKDYLGDEMFFKTFREFMHRWNGKHPTPYDLFYTFNDVCKQNLNWLIKPWFFEFGYVDQAISGVNQESDYCTIRIENKGTYPAPVRLKITDKDGKVQYISKNAGIWKNGDAIHEIKVMTRSPVNLVELIDNLVPDAFLSNNVWKKTKNL